jgi:hypothetical protein
MSLPLNGGGSLLEIPIRPAILNERYRLFSTVIGKT